MKELGTAAANDWMKFWAENQKSLFQSWVEGKAPVPSGVNPSDPMAELMTRSMEEWAALAKEAWSQSGRFDAETVQKFFDPAEWKRAGTRFDMGLEKLTEGPTYATLWNLDRKILGAQKLWMDRTRDIELYYEVVQSAWNKAFERFMATINDPQAPPIKSGREMLDTWLGLANTALVEMHRSKEFLDAQRRMTRSSTDYRLAEQEIAEAFCEIHHIPTRTEMDEMQRSVTELKRELRALRRNSAGDPATPAKKAAPKPARKRAKKRRQE